MEHSTRQYAGFWIRALALGVDMLLYSALLFLAELAFGRDTLLAKAVGAAIVAAFYIGCLSSPWQATPGKRLLKLRIERTNAEPLDIKHAAFRCLAVSLPFLPMFLLSFHPAILQAALEFQAALEGGLLEGELVDYFYQAGQHRLVMLAYGSSTVFFLVAMPFWYLPAAFTKEKKAVHDMLCKTRVVSGR